MVITIRDPETEALVRQLAARTGTSLTGSVRDAVVASLRRLPEGDLFMKRTRLEQIAARGRARRVLDRRTPEEIIDYDGIGLPRG